MKNLFSFKVKSFVLGRGRITTSQSEAIEKFGNEWMVKAERKKIIAQDLFGNKAPTTLEIGFGMGDVLIDSAIKSPDFNFIGIEVYKPGIGKVLNCITMQGITNIKLIEGDAVEICESMFKEKNFSNINLFFPDPWPKKKHHKRRIVKQSFVDSIAKNLALTGCFHCATDNENYAKEMLVALSNCKKLKNLSDGFCSRPLNRIISKFEAKAIKSNRKIFNLSFVRKF